MKKMLLLTVLALFCLSLGSIGCQIVASPAAGTIYTEVKAPFTATSNVTSSKVGKATCTSILGLVATGDASIDTAAKNGGITKIHHVDYKSFNILGIYGKFTTIVYGD